MPNAPDTTTTDNPVTLEAWRDYRLAALTSRERKDKQQKAVRRALMLVVSGTFLATLPGFLRTWSVTTSWPDLKAIDDITVNALLSFLSAAMFTIAGFVGNKLLSPEAEKEWVHLRVLAEAIKQCVYKRMMRVPPFDGDNADKVLEESIADLWAGAVLKPDPLHGDDRPLPPVVSLEDYHRERVREQIDKYYLPKARDMKKQLHKYRRAILWCSGATAILSLLGALTSLAILWAPFVTTLAGVLTALAQGSRMQTMIPLYLDTGRQLSRLSARYERHRDEWNALDPAERKQREQDFVLECETVLSNESQAWRAEWYKSDEKGLGQLVSETTAAAQEHKN